ncbi:MULTISPECIES: hypothetical protein [Neorhizobium]|uniref:hypothetical protein n=1 Tax=Neorhizobium sp. T6_25 TaxID=2093833 RepID=UPI001FDF5408|nr:MULTISPECIES: hypothetical protein [Neorhizobium]
MSWPEMWKEARSHILSETSLTGTFDVMNEGGKTMKVSQIMSRDVEIASPHQTVAEIARCMADRQIGFFARR